MTNSQPPAAMTPNAAAALERLQMVIGSLRNFADVADRCVITEVVNSIPAMRLWADELSEIFDELATLRASLATVDPVEADNAKAADDELPGMWSRSDFTGGATDAEHRQARELRTIVAGIDASESMPPTPHPDCNALVKLVDTNDWAIIRAALLRQREVTDAMMERAIKGWLAHQNKCRITTADGCLRAALTAALQPATSGETP